MKIIEVKGNTYCIDTGLSYIPFYKVNGKEIILLDTGLAQGERGVLDRYFQENDLNIAGIICTHAHIDHIGNASYYRQKYNCNVAMSEDEAFVCKKAANLKMYFSYQTMKEIEEYFAHMVCKVDVEIKDCDDEVKINGVTFNITHTPGHSVGHICITTPDNVTYLGDSLISYEVMSGAKMPYAFLISQDLKSKENLYNLKSSKYIVAHKGIYDDITTLVADNIELYKLRTEKVCELITEPLSVGELVSKIARLWNINIKNIRKYSVIERIVRSYIDYLVEIDKIKVTFDDGQVKYEKVV